IPGSHFEGDRFARSLHDTLPDHQATLGLDADQLPCTVIESHPGDVIIFNYRIQHATCDTEHPRRMFHYGISPAIPDTRKAAAPSMVGELLGRFKQPVFPDPLYHHPDPDIQRALAPLKALAAEIDTRPQEQS